LLLFRSGLRQGAFRAPPEIKADGNLQLDVLRKVNQSGDPSAFDEPANKAAEARTHAFDLANCGRASADVTAKDYSYSGVPGSAKPGPLSIQLANKGKESHEFSLFRINDGVNESVKDIVALPEAEAMKKVTMVGATFAEPGGRTTRCSSLTVLTRENMEWRASFPWARSTTARPMPARACTPALASAKWRALLLDALARLS